MGNASSSAQATGPQTAAPVDNEWILQNVLFFNPQEQAASGGGRHAPRGFFVGLTIHNSNHNDAAVLSSLSSSQGCLLSGSSARFA